MKISILEKIITYIGLVLISLFCLFPFLWMISTSFKDLSEIYSIPIRWLPSKLSIDSYVNIWTIQNFLIYFKNSLILSIASTVVSIVFGAMAAYGFSRFKYRLSKSLMIFILISQMFPGILLIIPYFNIASKLGLINTYTPLILAYTSFALPFSIWMLKGFFDSLPKEMDEAARIDGCSNFNVFLLIIIPLAGPALVATAVFSFLLGWNEYLFALVLAFTQDMYTVTVGIANNIGQFRINWNDLMAASIVASIPTIIFYAFLQKYLISGLTAGAVKS